ncbi:hypothetical protein Tco_1569703 [Tanacetum coccineum]
MVNAIPLDHVDDVPVVEPNQHDDVLVVPEPVLENEDEDLEEEEFEEEEEPLLQEDRSRVISDSAHHQVDENDLELTYPYEEVDPLNPHRCLLSQEPLRMLTDGLMGNTTVCATRMKTVPTCSMKVVSHILLSFFFIEDSDKSIAMVHDEGDINSALFLVRMTSLSRRLCGRETAHALVEKKGKAKDEYYGKLILDLGNEVRSSMEQGTTAMEKLVERLGNAEDKAECKKLKKQGLETYSFKSVDAAIAAERARHANAGNDARGSRPVRGQDATPTICECTFAGFMKCNPIAFHGTEGAVELQRWFEKTESVFGISECAEGKKVKFAAATLQGPALTWWNAKVVTMGLKTVNQMPWTEMKQLMIAEFYPVEEVQRMEHEPWNLKVKEYNIVAYT